MRPYIDPRDHAFADGPAFTRPASLAVARALFDRPEDGERLMALFEDFDAGAEAGEGLRLGLHARLLTPKAERRVRIGRDCVIRGIIRCEGEGRVQIGDLVYIGDEVIVSARTGVRIGEGSLLAHRAQVFDNDTHPTDAAEREAHYRAILKLGPRRDFAIPSAPVSIGARCWIGFGAAVMKGVSLGDETIVAAGAVVTRDAPKGSTLAGIPARPVKARGGGIGKALRGLGRRDPGKIG